MKKERKNDVNKQRQAAFTLTLIAALGLANQTLRANETEGADHASAILEQMDVAPVWSAHRTGAPELLTADGHQYVIYYDANRYFTIAQRKLDERQWKYRQFPVQMRWATGSHAKISMEIDRLGYLHLSCYRRDGRSTPLLANGTDRGGVGRSLTEGTKALPLSVNPIS